MSDTTAADGQEPNVATEALAATASEPITPEINTETAKTGLDALSADDLKKMIKDLRSESASHRSKLSAYEKAEEDRRAASLSELEQAQEQARKAGEILAETHSRMARRDALAALKEANVIDPDLAYMAIKDQIKIAGNGEPENLGDLVADFVKSRPAMVAQAAPVAPETKSTNPPTQSAPAAPGRSPGRL
jgi:hypothetical protein